MAPVLRQVIDEVDEDRSGQLEFDEFYKATRRRIPSMRISRIEALPELELELELELEERST